MQEFTRILHQLKLNTGDHFRSKRDISFKNTTILESLVNICFQLNNDFKTTPKPQHTSTPILSKNKNEISRMDYNGGDHPKLWKNPDLCVLNVRVERNETTAVFVFNVRHSSQAFVTQTESFNSFNKLIGPSGRYKQILTTEMKIPVDLSTITPEWPDFSEFVFGLSGDKRFKSTMDINFQKFDKFEQFKNFQEDRTWVTYNTTDFEQSLWRPFYRLISENIKDGYAFLKSDDRLFLDVDIFMDKLMQFSVRSFLWDWDNSTGLEYYTNPFHYSDIHYDTTHVFDDDPLFIVRIIGCTLIDSSSHMPGNDTGINTQNERDENSNKVCRFRILENFGKRRLSGRVSLHFAWRDGDYRVKNIVRGSSYEYTIYLRLPYELRPFPTGAVYFTYPDSEFGPECRPEHFTSCFISCYVEGSDIHSISILKESTYLMPQSSASTVINGETAWAMISVGSNSKDIDGRYRCLVVTTSGTIVTRTFGFYSTQFTKVLNLTMSLHEVDDVEVAGKFNLTKKDRSHSSVVAKIECVVEGFKPVRFNMMIYGSFSNVNVAEKSLFTELQELDEEKTQMIAILEKKYVRKPYMSLRCEADGPRGRSGKQMVLLDN